MKYPGMRRFLLAAAAASSVLLASCGGGSVVGQITPSRIVVLGDAFSDVGQSGNKYTVNDGSVNNWTQQLASSYGLTITAQSAGGTGYAQGNARITLKPDAGGGNVRTVTEQVDAFLAAGTPQATDLVVLGGGLSDIIVETMNTAQGAAQRLANVQQAARELAAQVRRVVNAGGKQVVIVGVYDIGRTPWAKALGRETEIRDLAAKFNEALKVALADLGNTVLYLDTANYFNFLFNQPASFDLSNIDSAVCTATASGTNGIGISASAHVSSRVCTGSTLVSGANVDTTMFADPVYPTPRVHRLFGDNAYNRIHERF